MTAVYTNAPITAIAPSKTNPRKTFAGLDELAESARNHGIIVPMLVRPHPKPSGLLAFELVAGERRWRAAKIAKLAEVPILVRELSDKAVLEIQVIENLQRADVHPLEEADGFEELIEKHGYDVDSLADKIGKSKAYVYARLKLCSLAPAAREAFLEERLSASIALLIARIADVQLQEQATRDVLGETTYGDLDDESDLDDDTSPLSVGRRELPIADGGIERIPMSVREAQIHLQRRYMLRLSVAKFTLADAQLVPHAGACTSCEFRSGNQRELFADVESADMCTKPSCFEAKTKAAWDIRAKQAEERGLEVVEAKDAERVFTPSGQTRPTSPYVEPTDKVPHDLLPAGTTKQPTWEQLLGKKLGDQAPKVLVQDLSGAPRELLDKTAVVKALREVGKIDKPLKPGKSSNSSSSKDPMKDQAANEEAKRQLWGRTMVACLQEAWATSAKLDPKDPAWWKWLCEVTIGQVGNPRIIGADDEDAKELLGRAKTIADYMRLITTVVLDEIAGVANAESPKVWFDPAKDKRTIAALELLGIDYDAHLRRVKESDKTAAKAEKQIAAKKPAKKGKAK